MTQEVKTNSDTKESAQPIKKADSKTEMCSQHGCSVGFTFYKSKKRCKVCEQAFCDSHLRGYYWVKHILTDIESPESYQICLQCIKGLRKVPKNFILGVKLKECSLESCHEIESPISKLTSCKNCGRFYCRKHMDKIDPKRKSIRKGLPYDNATGVCVNCSEEACEEKPSIWQQIINKFKN